MKPLNICLLIALMLFLGCSNTTVHLHVKNLPDAEQESIRADLEKRGFLVKMRDNEPPSNNNLILYYPHRGIEDDLRAINDVLDVAGFTAESSYLVHTDKLGKHEYSAGNIGLYLVPKGYQRNPGVASRVRSVFPMTIVDYEFVSTDCDKDYVYEFFGDGTLELSDFSLPVGAAKLATLSWQVVGDNMVLTGDGETFTYKKSESHREHTSQYSEYVVTYNITLQPEGYYRVPFGCQYKSTFYESF